MERPARKYFEQIANYVKRPAFAGEGERMREPTATRGPRPNWVQLNAEEDRVLKLLEEQRPDPTGPKAFERGNDLLESVEVDPDRIPTLRALMRAAIGPGNPSRTTPEYLVAMASTSATYPTFARDTVSAFANDQVIRERRHVLSYMRCLALLEATEHPCTKDLIFRALYRAAKPVQAMGRLLSFSVAEEALVDRYNLIDEGRALYRWAGSERPITPYEIEEIANSHLFPKLAIKGTAFATSIRPAIGGVVLCSELEFTYLQDERRVAGDKYIHVKTRAGGKGVRASGFVIPRRSGVYTVQQHSGGWGFNLAGFTHNEVLRGDAIEKFAFLRSTLISLDDDRPIVSRCAVVPELKGLRGTKELSEIEAKLTELENPPQLDEIMDFLLTDYDAHIAIPTMGGGDILHSGSWADLHAAMTEEGLSDSEDDILIQMMNPLIAKKGIIEPL